jgi:signal transduction histidine kinase
MISKFYNLPISTKLAVSFLIIIIIFTKIGSLIISELTYKYIDDTTKKSIELTFANNQESLTQKALKDDKWALYKFVKSISHSDIIYEATIYNHNGVIAHSNPKKFPIGTILDTQYLSLGETFSILLGDKEIAKITIFKNQETIQKQVNSIITSIIILSLIVALCSWLFAIFITKRILDRLKIASKNVEFISKGEWDKIEYKKFKEKDELSLLIESMYKMSNDIQANIKNIKSLKKFYHLILSNLDLLVVVLDEKFQNIYNNNHQLLNIFPITFFQELLQKSTDSSEIYEIKHGNKVFLVSIVFFDSNYLISISDITQIKELEKKYSTSKSLALLGEMSGFLSHELKNIISPLKLLIDAKNIDSKDIEVMRKSIKNMDTFIQNFLNFAKPTSNEKELTNFASSINEVLSLVSSKINKKSIVLNTQIDDNISIMMHTKALEIVVLNLLLNAIDAVDYCGEITLKAYETQDDIHLEIIDNGCGISNELIDQVFNPFFTTKSYGTGLGLALVFRIVDDLDGEILVDSNQGLTKFTVIFDKSLELAEEIK